MNLKDPESMNGIIGNILRLGVVLSAAIVVFGLALLVYESGLSSVGSAFNYNPSIPHDGFDVSLPGLFSGLMSLQPFSIIELGIIVLLATPVSRVLTSVFLFMAEGDRLYVIITAVVLVVLLFSMLVTPFIPGFNL